MGHVKPLRVFRLAALLVLVWRGHYVSGWRWRRIVFPVEDRVWLLRSVRVVWIG